MSAMVQVLGTIGAIGLHGKKTLENALKKHPPKQKIKIGLSEDAKQQGYDISSCPQAKESYALVVENNEYLLLGYDETGLMYGCQEFVETIEAGKPVVPFFGKPHTKTRGIYSFLHNEELEKEWFFNPVYWIDFFDEMAKNRYNSYNLVFSHQTSYLVPMFAYFLDMPEFPDVYPEGYDHRMIRRNHQMLSFIAEQAEKRGIDFILGIWQVSPWKGEQVIPVHGLTRENLEEYTYIGMKHIIDEFPAIKGLQIRANWESGIPTEEQTDFFTSTLFKAMSESPRPFIFDFRCWLAEPQTVQNALDMVPGTRLSCKYWAEFLGAPYQPAKISAGYSYSDFLRQPMKTDFIYQVWSLGSPRLLLWGDPEYVRRFVGTLTLGGGTGFEINLPLAQKGYGNEKNYWRIFKNADDEYYTHEYERYWLMNRLFGRLSYNPNCCEDAWMNEMRKRLGDAAADAMKIYQAGSEIITFLIQYTLADPNMYIWPEIDTNGSLDIYMKTPTSDECVIDGIEEYVERLFRGEASGKFTPCQAADHFEKMAKAVFDCISTFSSTEKEGISLRKDFTVLALLAYYHASKIRAAVALKKWYVSHDIHQLYLCKDEIHLATVFWERIISETENYYYDQMVTGPNDAGCWKTKRTLVWSDEMHVDALLREAQATAFMRVGFDFGPRREERVCRNWHKIDFAQNYPEAISYLPVSATSCYNEKIGYGFVSGNVQDVIMPRVLLSDLQYDPWSRDNWRHYPVDATKGFESALLEDAVTGNGKAVFQYDLPNGEYLIEVLLEDHTDQSCLRGPMDIGICGIWHSNLKLYPCERKLIRERVMVQNERLEITFNGKWFISALHVYDCKPVIRTMPYLQLNPDHTQITASIWAPDGIMKAALYHGCTPVAEMEAIGNGLYKANVRSWFANQEINADVFELRATDANGKTETVSIHVFYMPEPATFTVIHKAVENCILGKDTVISCRVQSIYPVDRMVLHYSYVNQFEPMHDVEMIHVGDEWQACIPADYPKYEWDLLYYIEITDKAGNGILYPDFRETTPYYVVIPER